MGLGAKRGIKAEGRRDSKGRIHGHGDLADASAKI